MTQSLLAYLPPHLTTSLLAHPDTSPIEQVQEEKAVALFASISGFTPMCEALGQATPDGTVEFSHILNCTLGTIIGIIQSYGGSIGKFSGDALVVVFPYQARTQRTTVRRAIQCALHIQDAMHTQRQIHTSAGTFSLTIQIGLGMGALVTTTVGDPTVRLEYLLAGSAIERCATAEQHAAPHAVIVCDDLLPLANAYNPQPIEPGFSRITWLRRSPTPTRWRPISNPCPTIIPTIARYLPPSLVERQTQGQHGFINEYRTVTTMFVRFECLDYRGGVSLGRLQNYLREIIQISDSHGGSLHQINIGNTGGVFSLLFGAPAAYEDNTERALLCALDLRWCAELTAFATATGISTGRIFCGLVGSDARREYTIIGESVKVGTHLMKAAQRNQILVDAPTRRSVSTTFGWKDLPMFTVKGVDTPIAELN